MRHDVILVALLVTASVQPRAQAPQVDSDPRTGGTWKVNIAKSTYSPGLPPAPTTVQIRRSWMIEGGWNVLLLTSIDAKGTPSFELHTYKIDGKPYPLHNAETLAGLMAHGRQTNLTRSYRRIDPSTVEFTTYTDGKPGGPTGTVSVSKDGKTSTMTQKGTNARGQQINNIVVSEKVN